MLLGPPKSKPGQRIVGIPRRDHLRHYVSNLSVFVKDSYGARPAGGQPALRRSAHRHQISPLRAPEAATAAIKIVVQNDACLYQVVRGELRDHHLLYATRADFLRRLGRNSEAANARQKALKRAHTDVERRSPNRRPQDVKPTPIADGPCDELVPRRRTIRARLGRPPARLSGRPDRTPLCFKVKGER